MQNSDTSTQLVFWNKQNYNCIFSTLHCMIWCTNQAAAVFLEYLLLHQDFRECLIRGTACSVFWMAVGEEPLAWPVASKLHEAWDVKETWQLQHSESICSEPCRSSQTFSGVSTSIDKYVFAMIIVPVNHKPKKLNKTSIFFGKALHTRIMQPQRLVKIQFNGALL